MATASSLNPPTPRTSRPSFHLPRLRMGWPLLLFLACLATSTLAQSETAPPAITSPASLPASSSPTVLDLPETLVTASEDVVRKDLRKRTEEESEFDEESTSVDDEEELTKTEEGFKTTLTISIEATSSAAAAASPLPQPFDGNIAAEITSSQGSDCPNFLSSLMESPPFEACYPLSLLIQTSRGFFDAQKQLLSIVRVLDATCSANVTYCADYLSTAAKNLTSAENCRAEWNNGDATVKQVLFGLKAYEMMYKATCLTTPDDDMYCFANAVTNLTTPSDAYFYYLPYNLSLPGSSVPSCSWCIEETMAIFHAASADRSLSIANTYEAAAQQVNTICGRGFVNATLPKEETSSTMIILPPMLSVAISILGAALVTAIL